MTLKAESADKAEKSEPPNRKAEQIFAAAEAIFLEVGYGAASMDAVASRAGVSKATIYVHFAGKRALFEAIIRRRAESVFGQLTLPDHVTDLRQILSDLALNYTAMILRPEVLAMYRVVLAEVVHQPEVGEAFYHAGPLYGRRKVADFFTALGERGLLKLDSEQAPIISDLFLSMLANHHQMRALFTRHSDPERRRKTIEAAVDLLIGRFG